MLVAQIPPDRGHCKELYLPALLVRGTCRMQVPPATRYAPFALEPGPGPCAFGCWLSQHVYLSIASTCQSRQCAGPAECDRHLALGEGP